MSSRFIPDQDLDASRERNHAVVELAAGAMQNQGDVRKNMQTTRHAFNECQGAFKSNWKVFRAVANQGFKDYNQGADAGNAFRPISELA